MANRRLRFTRLIPPPSCFLLPVFQFGGFAAVLSDGEEDAAEKINLYPRVFVALPPLRQCVSVISRPVWFQAFQRGCLRLPTFSPFCS